MASVPLGLSQGGGSVDVFVGSTPTPVATPTPTATPGVSAANIWVKTGGAGATPSRSGTAIAYNATNAYGDLNTAFQAASNGDVIGMKGGTYTSAQQINTRTGSAAPGVTFQPATGDTVIFTAMVNFEGADYWTFKGTPATLSLFEMDLTGNLSSTVDGVTVSNNYAKDNRETVAIVANASGNSDGVTFKNSDICCSWDKRNIFIDDNGGTISNVTIQGNTLRDQQQTDASIHDECIFATDVNGLTIRANRFWNCHGTGSIELGQSAGGSSLNNVLIENNVIEPTIGPGKDSCCGTSAYTVQLDPTQIRNFEYRYNLLATPVVLAAPVTGYFRMTGNVGGGGSCVSGVTFSKNIWTDMACTGDNAQTSTILSSGNFVSSSAHNWRPSSASAPQIDKGSLTNFPTADADGIARYLGAAPDAGPYEGG